MRIYTHDNTALDFCGACRPTEEEALAEYGPDVGGYAYDADHLPYDDSPPQYCNGCGAVLIPIDDFPLIIEDTYEDGDTAAAARADAAQFGRY